MIVGCNNVKRLEHFYGSHGTFYDSPVELASALSQDVRSNVHAVLTLEHLTYMHVHIGKGTMYTCTPRC